MLDIGKGKLLWLNTFCTTSAVDRGDAYLTPLIELNKTTVSIDTPHLQVDPLRAEPNPWLGISTLLIQEIPLHIVEKLLQSQIQGDENEDQYILIQNRSYYFVYSVASEDNS